MITNEGQMGRSPKMNGLRIEIEKCVGALCFGCGETEVMTLRGGILVLKAILFNRESIHRVLV